MARFAIFKADGSSIERFADAVDARRTSLPVVEEKPALLPDQELTGPNYRIEPDRVVAVYEAVPIDPVRPDVFLARIAKLEADVAALKGSR